MMLVQDDVLGAVRELSDGPNHLTLHTVHSLAKILQLTLYFLLVQCDVNVSSAA